MDRWSFVTQSTGGVDGVLRRAPLDERTLGAWVDQLLAARGLSKADAIRRSGLNRTFGYQILSGRRKPTRDKLIQLALGMGFGIAEADELLERGGTNRLRPSVARDVAIAFCLTRGLTVEQSDEVLLRAGLPQLRVRQRGVPPLSQL